MDGGTEGVIHVPRPLRQPLSVLVAPIPELSISWAGFHPRWMLFFFDPESTHEVCAGVLAADLGLTEREAQIVVLLTGGCDLRQVALRLGISIHTARVHLKTVFAKTGVHSQAELVGRVMRSPAGALRR